MNRKIKHVILPIASRTHDFVVSALIGEVRQRDICVYLYGSRLETLLHFISLYGAVEL